MNTRIFVHHNIRIAEQGICDCECHHNKFAECMCGWHLYFSAITKIKLRASKAGSRVRQFTSTTRQKVSPRLTNRIYGVQ